MRILLFCFIFIFSSCSITNNVNISNETSVNIDYTSSEYFSTILEDISSFAYEEELTIEDSILNIYYNIYNTKTAKNTSLVKTGKDSYFLTFNTNNINTLFNELAKGEQTILKQTTNELEFCLNINNYQELVKIIPELKDPNLEVYLAPYNIGYNQEDYLAMMEFSFSKKIRNEILNSNIVIKGKTDKEITNIINAEKLSSQEFKVVIPLIDFLLLDQEIYFKVSYK